MGIMISAGVSLNDLLKAVTNFHMVICVKPYKQACVDDEDNPAEIRVKLFLIDNIFYYQKFTCGTRLHRIILTRTISNIKQRLHNIQLE